MIDHQRSSYVIFPLKSGGPAVPPLSRPRTQRLRPATNVLTHGQDVSQQPLRRRAGSRGERVRVAAGTLAGVLAWEGVRGSGGRRGAGAREGGLFGSEGLCRGRERRRVKRCRTAGEQSEGGDLLSAWAKAQKGPLGQLPLCCMSLHLVDL